MSLLRQEVSLEQVFRRSAPGQVWLKCILLVDSHVPEDKRRGVLAAFHQFRVWFPSSVPPLILEQSPHLPSALATVRRLSANPNLDITDTDALVAVHGLRDAVRAVDPGRDEWNDDRAVSVPLAGVDWEAITAGARSSNNRDRVVAVLAGQTIAEAIVGFLGYEKRDFGRLQDCLARVLTDRGIPCPKDLERVIWVRNTLVHKVVFVNPSNAILSLSVYKLIFDQLVHAEATRSRQQSDPPKRRDYSRRSETTNTATARPRHGAPTREASGVSKAPTPVIAPSFQDPRVEDVDPPAVRDVLGWHATSIGFAAVFAMIIFSLGVALWASDPVFVAMLRPYGGQYFFDEATSACVRERGLSWLTCEALATACAITQSILWLIAMPCAMLLDAPWAGQLFMLAAPFVFFIMYGLSLAFLYRYFFAAAAE